MQRDMEMQRTIDALTEVVRDMRMSHPAAGGGSNIQVNGGGIGVWIATVCCALMLGVSAVSAMVILDHSRQISDLRDHLTVIYAQAPHLKAKAEEDSP